MNLYTEIKLAQKHKKDVAYYWNEFNERVQKWKNVHENFISATLGHEEIKQTKKEKEINIDDIFGDLTL